MFSERYEGMDLNDVLLQREDYHPFPTVLERDSWEKLSDKLKRDMIKEGEKYIDFAWPSLPAVRFMDFKRDGNRSKYEAFHFERRKALAYLVLAQCIEGGDRFLDDIINGIWCICEESFWGVPAHNYNSRNLNSALPDITEPIIDLFAAETGGLMAWVVYLLQVKLDEVTPLVCERIRTETK